MLNLVASIHVEQHLYCTASELTKTHLIHPTPEAYQAAPQTGEQKHFMHLDVSTVKNFISYYNIMYNVHVCYYL